MPKIELTTLLNLVGELVDSKDGGSASQRFREYLQGNVEQAADLREYIEDALAQSGSQFNKALQDLINHLGQLLGFTATYGRYRGVQGEIGFDGLWQSPTGWAVVVEAKTTDVYTVKTSTLLGYINDLISAGQIKSPNEVLGLYVYGRFDTRTSQLENAITAEGRNEKLRVVSVEALLNLLSLKQEYGLAHGTILRLLRPAPVRIDPLINLISDVVAQEKEESDEVEPEETLSPTFAEMLVSVPSETCHKKRPTFSNINEDYTGRSIIAFAFQGKRHPTATWKAAATTLFTLLEQQAPEDFREAAFSIKGRKRPYFTSDKTQLRQPAQIPRTDIWFEANLSANSMVKLCYTLVDRMGIPRDALSFEVES